MHFYSVWSGLKVFALKNTVCVFTKNSISTSNQSFPNNSLNFFSSNFSPRSLWTIKLNKRTKLYNCCINETKGFSLAPIARCSLILPHFHAKFVVRLNVWNWLKEIMLRVITIVKLEINAASALHFLDTQSNKIECRLYL